LSAAKTHRQPFRMALLLMGFAALNPSYAARKGVAA
jgi:hypothetical protein